MSTEPAQAASPTAERGSVTAELAIGLTAATVVLGALLGTASVAQAQLRVLDAAGAGARAAARGAGEAEVFGLTRRLAGDGASVDVSSATATVTVTVALPVDLPLPGTPRVTVRGAATTPAEPQVTGS